MERVSGGRRAIIAAFKYLAARTDNVASLTPELYEIIVKIVEDKVKEIKVTREEFDKLVATVGQLAEAQRRTEERLNQLAERVDQLAEAQRRTEERLNQLAERVDQLAEAQRRTEERLNQLAERVDQLAEAQRRTEERLNQLAEAVVALNKSVAALGDVIGFGLEDIARVVLPGWLHRHLGVEVGELTRRFISAGGEEHEVNLYGEGERGGRRVVVIGEAKSRIHESDVDRFWGALSSMMGAFEGAEVIGVMFGYLIYPRAKERAEEKGIYVVASYER